MTGTGDKIAPNASPTRFSLLQTSKMLDKLSVNVLFSKLTFQWLGLLNRPSTTDDAILHGLSPAALTAYCKVCKATRQIAESYIKREFSLNRVLSRFFSPLEILRLRYFQSRTQMFISGSTALQFFDRTCYPESDLDLYVEHKFRETIVTWLMSMDYKFQPRKGYSSLKEQLEHKWDDPTPGVSPSSPFFESRSNGYFGRGVANVYNFFKYDPERKIQLITSNHSPLEIVLNFHSSTCLSQPFATFPDPFWLSLRNEYPYPRQGIFVLPQSNFWRTTRPYDIHRRFQTRYRPCEICFPRLDHGHQSLPSWTIQLQVRILSCKTLRWGLSLLDDPSSARAWFLSSRGVYREQHMGIDIRFRIFTCDVIQGPPHGLSGFQLPRGRWSAGTLFVARHLPDRGSEKVSFLHFFCVINVLIAPFLVIWIKTFCNSFAGGEYMCQARWR